MENPNVLRKYYRLKHKDENIFTHESLIGEQKPGGFSIAYDALRRDPFQGWKGIPRKWLRLSPIRDPLMTVRVRGVCCCNSLKDLQKIFKSTPCSQKPGMEVVVFLGIHRSDYEEIGFDGAHTFVVKPTKIISTMTVADAGLL